VKRIAFIAVVVLIAAACDGKESDSESSAVSTTTTTTEAPGLEAPRGSIALMPLPQAELGKAFADFYLDRDCGPLDNYSRLDDVFDAYGSEEELRRAGRRGGYRLAYANPDFAVVRRGGTGRIATTIDEFASAREASAFLRKLTTTIEQSEGTRPDEDIVIRDVAVSPLPNGSEGRILRMTVDDLDTDRSLIFETASFRIGALVASVERTSVGASAGGDLAALAERLAERVSGVRGGAITSTERVAVSFEVQYVDYTQHGTARVTYADPQRGSVTEMVELPWESERFVLERGTEVRVSASDGADLVCAVDLGQGPYGITASGACPIERTL
jgi:hypothetical protein